jgi:hypothetical protein
VKDYVIFGYPEKFHVIAASWYPTKIHEPKKLSTETNPKPTSSLNFLGLWLLKIKNPGDS